MLKEMAVGSTDQLERAIKRGVARIELNENLAVGGLTPSQSMIEQTLAVADTFGVPVAVMVRPRPGDFVYSHREIEKMCDTLKRLRSLGVEAVTFGAVLSDGKLDRANMVKLLEAAQPMDVIFHMAFDTITSEQQVFALDWLERHQVKRVLTHGGAMQQTIQENLPHLTWLCQQAPANLTILPGGGITYQNCEAICDFLGVEEVHGSKIVCLD
ncbi:copper homeostasis protein [Weissella uvarum]|uniref:copper homeostasis protein CutC n=1 Tax=Weissella uvarum TaxID=1479233 RepID=UPI0019616618|nr:copper homeostasis protein CutC [Weissella uvarum]MBM7616983.1 copper homeostasis protein [Weissella uvarum]MCM0595283.1 copper homeostasis protein CutC [Weissella uvarum]